MIKVIEEPLQVNISHVLYLSVFVWLYVCMHLIYSMSVVSLSVCLFVSVSLSLSLSPLSFSLSLPLSLSVSLSLSLCFTVSLFLSQAMKSGLYDVLPVTVLEGLTAEDMRLLLCGCQQVELDILKKITTFTDESRKLHDGHDMIITFVIMNCTCIGC